MPLSEKTMHWHSLDVLVRDGRPHRHLPDRRRHRCRLPHAAARAARRAPPPLPVRTSLANLDFALPCAWPDGLENLRARNPPVFCNALNDVAEQHAADLFSALATRWRPMPNGLRGARTSAAAASRARASCIASTRRRPPRTASAAARAALRAATRRCACTTRSTTRRPSSARATGSSSRRRPRAARRSTATRAQSGVGCARVVVAEPARPAHRGKLDLRPPMGEPGVAVRTRTSCRRLVLGKARVRRAQCPPAPPPPPARSCQGYCSTPKHCANAKVLKELQLVHLSTPRLSPPADR